MKSVRLLLISLLTTLSVSCALIRIAERGFQTPNVATVVVETLPFSEEFPTVTVHITSTAEPTSAQAEKTIPVQTPAPTAAPTVVLPTPTTLAQADCPPYFKETFDQAPDCWDLDTISHITDIQNPDRLTWDVIGGMLKIDITTNEELYLYFFKEDSSYQDVILEAEVTNLNPGTTKSGIVLACRTSDQGWYEVRLEPGGFFYVYQFDFNLRQQGKNPYINLTSGGARSIRVGYERINTMTWKCIQDTLTFDLNGVEIWSGQPKSIYPDGGVALGVTTVKGSYPTHIGFESFSVLQP